MKNGSRRHISKAGYDAPTIENVRGAMDSKTIATDGARSEHRPGQTNQSKTKQNKQQNKTNQKPKNKLAHQRGETGVKTSAGLRQSLTRMHRHCPQHWGAVDWFRMQTWPGWLETSLGHPEGKQAATAACFAKAHIEDPVVSQLQNCPLPLPEITCDGLCQCPVQHLEDVDTFPSRLPPLPPLANTSAALSMRRLCRMCHEFPWPKYLRG